MTKCATAFTMNGTNCRVGNPAKPRRRRDRPLAHLVAPRCRLIADRSKRPAPEERGVSMFQEFRMNET